jgi:hypothetical protein
MLAPYAGMQVGHKTRVGCSSYAACVWGLEVELYLVLVAVAFNFLLSFYCAHQLTSGFMIRMNATPQTLYIHVSSTTSFGHWYCLIIR